MQKVININTTIDSVFKQYLTIVNVVLSKDKRLTNIQLEVLSRLLYVDYLYRHLDKDKRDMIIFHRETKNRIREAIGQLSDNSYKNILVVLRKKGFINGNTLIIRPPVLDGTIDIQFKLNLNAGTN